MEKLCVFLVLVIACNQALGMSLRQKRQSDSEEDLDDRYGWGNGPSNPNWNQFRPNRPGQGQGQFPGQGQGQFPGQGQGQFPGQGQGQFPGQGQGQFPGQGQLPGQGQGQFPGQGQGQFPGQGQGQLPGQGQGQFPGQGQLPGQGQGQLPGQGQGQQQPTTQAPGGSTTQSAAIRQCIQSCLVTPEFNPVCGSDNVTYTNPGRLICARDCGANVTQRRASPCPVAPAS